MEKPTPAYVLPLVLVAFPLYWCFICWLLARMGGWGRLAAFYPNRDGHLGKRLWMQSAAFSWVHYQGTLNLSADPDGLVMSVLLPFRYGHHPIRIPWGDLKVSQVESFWGDFVEVRTQRVSGAKLKLSTRTWKKLQQVGGEVVPTPEAGPVRT